MDGHTRPARRLVPDELEQVMRLARFRQAHPGVMVGAGRGERSWCKHGADLGFCVEDMYVTSAVSLSVTAAHRHQR